MILNKNLNIKISQKHNIIKKKIKINKIILFYFILLILLILKVLIVLLILLILLVLIVLILVIILVNYYYIFQINYFIKSQLF
jgi:hypothetical protein